MDNYDKVIALYKSGRYECDLFFYQKLYSIAQELDLFDALNMVSPNLARVQRVAQLTKKHLYVLEDEDNEEGALQILHEINAEIKSIDTDQTKQVLTQIFKMQGKSYKQKIINGFKTQPYKKMYLQVCERILNNVHDPKIILQQLGVLGIFMKTNQDKIAQYADIYNNVLTNGIEELKKFRENSQFISQHQQIHDHMKVKNYLKGCQVLFTKFQKFNEIYKAIKGDSKFGLKLGSFKHELESYKKLEGELAHQPLNIGWFLSQLVGQGQKSENVCHFCLRGSGDHPECRLIIKMFYRPVAGQ